MCHCMEASVWQRREGLNGLRSLTIGKWDREKDGQARFARQLLKQIDVATNERRLGDNAHRIPKLCAYLQTPARQLIVSFQRQVWVRGKREDYLVASPGWPH